jgi:ABC-type Fe3+-hydroxamate transport system substrate-binding protein
MKRLVAICLLVVLLAGCSGKESDVYEPENPQLTFTDSTGYFVKAPEAPRTVVVLDDSLARLWEMAGGTVQPESFSSKPEFLIGNARIPEQVTACEEARKEGVPAALMEVENFDSFLRTLDIFTIITANEDAMITCGNDQRREVEQVLQSLPEERNRKALVIRQGAAETEGFLCVMLEDLGAVLSQEDPEVLFVVGSGADTAQWPEAEIITLEEELFGAIPLDRWGLAYDILSKGLYPEK